MPSLLPSLNHFKITGRLSIQLNLVHPTNPLIILNFHLLFHFSDTPSTKQSLTQKVPPQPPQSLPH